MDVQELVDSLQISVAGMCENCGGKWGVATVVVNGYALCDDCAEGRE